MTRRRRSSRTAVTPQILVIAHQLGSQILLREANSHSHHTARLAASAVSIHLVIAARITNTTVFQRQYSTCIPRRSAANVSSIPKILSYGIEFSSSVQNPAGRRMPVLEPVLRIREEGLQSCEDMHPVSPQIRCTTAPPDGKWKHGCSGRDRGRARPEADAEEQPGSPRPLLVCIRGSGLCGLPMETPGPQSARKSTQLLRGQTQGDGL